MGDVGIYEMVNMAARFIGVGFILVAPIRRVKLTYMLLLGCQVVAYLLICLTHFFPMLFPAFFPLANVLIGLGTGLYMCPYLLLYKSFRAAEEHGHEAGFEFSDRIKVAFNIWMGLGILGHAYALLLGKWMLADLELDWIISLFTFTMLYLTTGLLTYALVPEQHIDIDNQEAELSIAGKTCLILKMLKGYYKRKASNVLVLVEYCFIDNQGAMIVYWMAYFFIRVGFGFDAPWVALGYPLGAAVGSFTTSPLVNLFPTYAPLTTSILLFLVCLLYNMFWLI